MLIPHPPTAPSGTAVSPTVTPSSAPGRRRGSLRTRRTAAAVLAAAALSASAAPLPAELGLGVQPASAADVLQQAQGSGPEKAAAPSPGSPNSPSSSGSGNLDAAPNWSAPGVKQGKELIGWAKAGAMIFGVLGLMGGAVIGKVLKDSGNHHATGVRATAMGIGGVMVLAGAAPEIVPWLMNG